MKIAFLGNIANNFYREVKSLQESALISADLYLTLNINDTTRLPESDEPGLSNNYPAWIKHYAGVKTSLFSLIMFNLGMSAPLVKLNRAIVDELNEYELCVFSGDEVHLAPLVKTKTLFRVTGADLTVYPSFTSKQLDELYPPVEAVSGVNMLIKLFIRRLEKKLWRDAINSCNYVDPGFGDPFERALKKIGISKEKVVRFFRLAIDTNVFQKRSVSEDTRKKWGLAGLEFIVFLPSRIMINNAEILMDTGQWKASDNAIYGFKHFLENVPKKKLNKIALLIPERTITPDLAVAKKIISILNISENVLFCSGSDMKGLSRDEMLDIYSLSNVVMDDFGAGWYGSVAVEALACGVPLVTYVPTKLLESMFPWHPIQVAKTPIEIGEALLNLYEDKETAENLSIKSKQWVDEFHSNAVVRKRLESSLAALLNPTTTLDRSLNE